MCITGLVDKSKSQVSWVQTSDTSTWRYSKYSQGKLSEFKTKPQRRWIGIPCIKGGNVLPNKTHRPLDTAKVEGWCAPEKYLRGGGRKGREMGGQDSDTQAHNFSYQIYLYPDLNLLNFEKELSTFPSPYTHKTYFNMLLARTSVGQSRGPGHYRRPIWSDRSASCFNYSVDSRTVAY